MAYYPAQFGNGAGNMATAIGLWDQFMGPTSQRNKQALENAKLQNAATQQGMELAKSAEQRAAELHGPNLATAKAVADIHANELAKTSLDRQTQEGSIKALNEMPANLWKPTSMMDPNTELPQWQALHVKNGVKDFNGAAKAWNAAMANVTGQAQPLRGMMNLQATQDPNGGVSTVASLKNIANPDELHNLGVEAPAPLEAPAAGWRPPMSLPPAVAPPSSSAGAVQPAPVSQTPHLPAAANPFISATAPGNAPSATALATVSPGTRAALSEGAEARGKFLGNTEKEIAMNKAKMEEFYGTPEERKADSEFIRNATQAMNRLKEYGEVVKAHGNTPGLTTDPNARAALHSLPLLIADNMSKVANPGGMLREGLVHLNKEDLIPAGWGTLSSTTSAAIERMRNVIGDYVKQYENIPWTRNPVEGLTPEDRQRVGPTKFYPADESGKNNAPMEMDGASPRTAVLPRNKAERDAAIAAGKWITDGKGNFAAPRVKPKSAAPAQPRAEDQSYNMVPPGALPNVDLLPFLKLQLH